MDFPNLPYKKIKDSFMSHYFFKSLIIDCPAHELYCLSCMLHLQQNSYILIHVIHKIQVIHVSYLNVTRHTYNTCYTMYIAYMHITKLFMLHVPCMYMYLLNRVLFRQLHNVTYLISFTLNQCNCADAMFNRIVTSYLSFIANQL